MCEILCILELGIGRRIQWCKNEFLGVPRFAFICPVVKFNNYGQQIEHTGQEEPNVWSLNLLKNRSKKPKQLICLKGSILYGSNKTSGNRLENKLAKFGYLRDIKVKMNTDLSIFLATHQNLSLKSGHSKKDALKSGKFRPFLSPKKIPLCRSKIMTFFSGQNFVKIHSEENHHIWQKKQFQTTFFIQNKFGTFFEKEKKRKRK